MSASVYNQRIKFVRNKYYLAVKAQYEQHKEEKCSPEWCQWHQGHSLWVGYKGQARTCTGGESQKPNKEGILLVTTQLIAVGFRQLIHGRAVFLPLSATLLMSTPCSAAMKPSTENTTKPAKKLVPLLMIASRNASLKTERQQEGERGGQWMILWEKDVH